MGLSADTLKVGKQAVRQGDLTIRLRGSVKLALLQLTCCRKNFKNSSSISLSLPNLSR